MIELLWNAPTSGGDTAGVAKDRTTLDERPQDIRTTGGKGLPVVVTITRPAAQSST